MRSLFSIWFLVFVHYCKISKRDFSVTLYSETLLGKQSLPSMKIYWKCLHQCMRQICAITIHLDILVAASFCQNGRWWLSKKISNSSTARKNGQEIEGSVAPQCTKETRENVYQYQPWCWPSAWSLWGGKFEVVGERKSHQYQCEPQTQHWAVLLRTQTQNTPFQNCQHTNCHIEIFLILKLDDLKKDQEWIW